MLTNDIILTNVFNPVNIVLYVIGGGMLLIIGISFLQIGFPFTALQSTLLSFFARGAPPLILAVVASAGRLTGWKKIDELVYIGLS